MRTNKLGIEIVKSFEGLEDGDPTTVNLDPYACPAKIWTIGWGHAIVYNKRFLKSTIPGDKEIAYSLYPGGITIAQAEDLLKLDLRDTEIQVEKALKVPVTENQFSALVSFTFNVGIGNLTTSTLLKKLHAGDIQGAADQFPRWNKANGQVLNGLIKRRYAEKDLFSLKG